MDDLDPMFEKWVEKYGYEPIDSDHEHSAYTPHGNKVIFTHRTEDINDTIFAGWDEEMESPFLMIFNDNEQRSSYEYGDMTEISYDDEEDE